MNEEQLLNLIKTNIDVDLVKNEILETDFYKKETVWKVLFMSIENTSLILEKSKNFEIEEEHFVYILDNLNANNALMVKVCVKIYEYFQDPSLELKKKISKFSIYSLKKCIENNENIDDLFRIYVKSYLKLYHRKESNLLIDYEALSISLKILKNKNFSDLILNWADKVVGLANESIESHKSKIYEINKKIRNQKARSVANVTMLTTDLQGWIKSNYNLSDGEVIVPEVCFYRKKNRADLILTLGTELIAFEVKSKDDNMNRWEEQQKAYLNVFDKVWLCINEKHLEKTYEKIHKNCGLIVQKNNGVLKVIRKAKNNINNPLDYTDLLWREDINEVLENNGHKIVRKHLREDAKKDMLAKVKMDIIKEKVIEVIKSRYKDYKVI